jgi:hypothetical protein
MSGVQVEATSTLSAAPGFRRRHLGLGLGQIGHERRILVQARDHGRAQIAAGLDVALEVDAADDAAVAERLAARQDRRWPSPGPVRRSPRPRPSRSGRGRTGRSRRSRSSPRAARRSAWCCRPAGAGADRPPWPAGRSWRRRRSSAAAGWPGWAWPRRSIVTPAAHEKLFKPCAPDRSASAIAWPRPACPPACGVSSNWARSALPRGESGVGGGPTMAGASDSCRSSDSRAAASPSRPCWRGRGARPAWLLKKVGLSTGRAAGEQGPPRAATAARCGSWDAS